MRVKNHHLKTVECARRGRNMKKSDFKLGIHDKHEDFDDEEEKSDIKKRRQLPGISEKAWAGVNELRKEKGITWNDLFERINNYKDWTEHLLKLTQKPSIGDKLNALTVSHYMPLWLDNLYENFLEEPLKDIHDVKDFFGTARDKPAIVIGAGPSLYKYNHLNLLAKSKFYKDKVGPILTTSHTVKDCLEHGVIPDYMILVDPEPIMLSHLDHEIIDKYADKIEAIFSITIHPGVLKRWKGNKHFFMSAISDATIPNVQAVLSGFFPMLNGMNGLANAGSFSWSIAKFLGCNPIALIGMDQAFLLDTPVEETPYYKAFQSSFKTRKEIIENCYRSHTHSFFKTDCYTDDIYGTFAKNTVAIAKRVKNEEGVITINATGGGFIDEPNIIENQWFEDFLKKYE